MRTKLLIFLLTIGFSNLYAQEKWNLRRIVEYAMSQNLTVRQLDVQSKNAELTYKQSKLSQYPTLDYSMSARLNSGSTQDPVYFNRTNQTVFASGMDIQTGVQIFNFYSKRNEILANEWELQAAKANTEKLRNDIALTVANAYLQVLLAMEQQKITALQLDQSRAQLQDVRKRVDAGALPELNASQLEAQIANDSFNYISAKGNVEQAILNLKANMSLDAATPFEIEAPPVDKIPVDPIGELQPDIVYALAIKNLPQQRYNDFKLRAAEFSSKSAFGAMKPKLTAFGSLSSGFNNQSRDLQTYKKIPYFRQISNNFGQGVGLGLSVPIFSGGSLRTNFERTKLSVQSLNIQKEIDNQKLKQDIYAAYNAAVVAMEKVRATERSVAINQKTYDFALKRHSVGMLGTYDLIISQNNLLRAKLEYALNKFDYVFKMKVLEFYKGQGLKL